MKYMLLITMFLVGCSEPNKVGLTLGAERVNRAFDYMNENQTAYTNPAVTKDNFLRIQIGSHVSDVYAVFGSANKTYSDEEHDIEERYFIDGEQFVIVAIQDDKVVDKFATKFTD